MPGVNNVKLTGPDGVNPWPRGPNPTGGYQLDGRFRTLQEQALGALVAHAQIQSPPQQRLLDDLSAFQRVLFTNERVRALSEAVDAGVTSAAGPGSAAQCTGATGQSGVHTLMRAMPRRPRTVDAAAAGHAHATTSHAVPAAGRHRDARPLQLQALPAAPRPQRADLRDHAADWRHDTPNQLRIPAARC